MAKLIQDKSVVRTCNQLLKQHARSNTTQGARLLQFGGVGDLSVYNITPPFIVGGRTLIAGRVEPVTSDWKNPRYEPSIRFFEGGPQDWEMCRDLAPIDMREDPAVAVIGGEPVLSGIEIYDDGKTKYSRDYRTVFYRYQEPNSWVSFTLGPAHMKDIRLIELPDSRIGVFTRPQGHEFGRGKVGFIVIDSLDNLTAQVLEQAELIPNHFAYREWGGVNQALLLSDGRIGCLGHVACLRRNGTRHYYATAFEFDPVTRATTSLRIIATRSDFPPAASKQADIVDCIFPGGIIRHPNGTTTLFAGLSDRFAGAALLNDPFAAHAE